MGEYNTHLKWSLLFIGTCFCWQVFERLGGWHYEQIELHFKFRTLFFILTTIFFFLGIRDIIKQENHKHLKKRTVLSHGLILTGIIALLMPASLWILYNFITPDFIANANDFLAESKKYSGNRSTSLSDKVLLTRIPFIFIIWGVINSAIMSFVFKIESTRG
ncbi:MAG: DUF4199 domain-containing protein [Saprospiraceae bacterium]|nr:DUF4199 domain-containing protein [Saprospiraceae bacterium]